MPKRVKQLEFSDLGFGDFSFRKPGLCFGGSLLKSNPKIKRPLDSKFPVHAILRANRSGMRSLKYFHHINRIVYRAAKKYGIKIYGFENVGNHIHLLIKLSHKRFWTPFIREVTSKIAFLMKDSVRVVSGGNASSKSNDFTNGLKSSSKTSEPKQDLNPSGNAAESNESQASSKATSEKFWKYRPYTRIIKGWKKPFQIVKQYLALNRAEAEGFINRKDIKTLKDLKAIFDG